MTWQEIITALTSGMIGPVIGVGFAITILAWRWWREQPPLTRKAEAMRIAMVALPVGAGALMMGQRPAAVIGALLSAVATAAGWNSQPLLPDAGKPTPEVDLDGAPIGQPALPPSRADSTIPDRVSPTATPQGQP
jgi:hypothetical protein